MGALRGILGIALFMFSAAASAREANLCEREMTQAAAKYGDYFNVSSTAGVVQGISYKHCSVIHSADGYSYQSKTGAPLGNELPSIRA